MKPIICLDFDGVVHSYTSGWKGARCIPDREVPGATEAIARYLGAGFDVVIHSSRARYFGGIRAMRHWLRGEAGDNLWFESPGFVGLEAVRFTRWKPAALVTLDDRALTFTGLWPLPNELRSFRPWNKPPEGS